MPQLNEPRATQIKRNTLSLIIGSLLIAAIVLNSTALDKKAWMEEKTSPIVTTYPVALLDLSMARTFTREDLSPTSPKGYAVYTGMRAGVYYICYTLANVTSEPATATEFCHSYRDLTYHRVFQRVVTKPEDDANSYNSFYTYAVSMCDLLDTRVVTFPDIGIPIDSLLPEFLNVFCGAPGRMVAIFQIVAIVSTAFSAVMWLCSLRSASNKVALLRAVMFAASAGFLLTLITCIMWIGAFQHSVKGNGSASLVQGESTHCTIAAAVLLFAGTLLAKLSARSYASAYNAQNSPNVPLV